jgi:hypothetical protein
MSAALLLSDRPARALQALAHAARIRINYKMNGKFETKSIITHIVSLSKLSKLEQIFHHFPDKDLLGRKPL